MSPSSRTIECVEQQFAGGVDVGGGREAVPPGSGRVLHQAQARPELPFRLYGNDLAPCLRRERLRHIAPGQERVAELIQRLSVSQPVLPELIREFRFSAKPREERRVSACSVSVRGPAVKRRGYLYDRESGSSKQSGLMTTDLWALRTAKFQHRQ